MLQFLTTAKSEFLTIQIYTWLTCRHLSDTVPHLIPSANSTFPVVITTKPKEEEKHRDGSDAIIYLLCTTYNCNFAEMFESLLANIFSAPSNKLCRCISHFNCQRARLVSIINEDSIPLGCDDLHMCVRTNLCAGDNMSSSISQTIWSWAKQAPSKCPYLHKTIHLHKTIQ